MYNFFILCMFMINVLSTKTINLPFLSCDLGLLLSPFVFAYMDIMTETKGEKYANKVVKSMGVCCCLMSFLLLIVSKIKTGNEEVDNAFALILGNNWRFIIASLCATIIGGICNNNLMKQIKGKYTVRAIGSSVVGQFVDNTIFTVLAFAPVLGHAWELEWIIILKMILTVTLNEVIIESILIVPLENLYFKKIKRA